MALKGVGVAVAEAESPLPVEDTVAVAFEESVAVGDAKSFASATDLPEQAPDKNLQIVCPIAAQALEKAFIAASVLEPHILEICPCTLDALLPQIDFISLGSG